MRTEKNGLKLAIVETGLQLCVEYRMSSFILTLSERALSKQCFSTTSAHKRALNY